MLARMQVEHEICQRPLQLRAQIPIDGKARARQLHGPLKIENTKLLSELPMRLGGEIKLRRRSPSPDFHVIVGTVADWHARMWQIRNADENIAQPRVQVGRGFFQRLNLLAQLFRLRHRRRRVLARLLQLGDFFRGLVALRLAGLSLGDRLPPLRINLAEILQHRSRVHAALAQLLLDERQIVTNKTQIQHRKSLLYRKMAAECTLRAESKKPGHKVTQRNLANPSWYFVSLVVIALLLPHQNEAPAQQSGFGQFPPP